MIINDIKSCTLTGKTSLTFISKYPTPHRLLNAPVHEVLNLLTTSSHKGLRWAKNKLELLLSIATSAQSLGIKPLTFDSKVRRFIETYNFYEEQRLNILNEIKTFINSTSFADELNHNISLLCSFKGTGYISSLTLLWK